MSNQRQPGKLRVFISYSRQDMAFVNRLQAALSERGIEVSVDRDDIEKGEAWWARITQLITEADTIVFVLSTQRCVPTRWPSPSASISASCRSWRAIST